MRTVFLIGTNHFYQQPGTRASEEFRTLVDATCQERNIKVIAEEMSLDALNKNSAQESICKQVGFPFPLTSNIYIVILRVKNRKSSG